jgi:hypothetical protein
MGAPPDMFPIMFMGMPAVPGWPGTGAGCAGTGAGVALSGG